MKTIKEAARKYLGFDSTDPNYFHTCQDDGYVCSMSYKRGMWSTMGYQSDIQYWRPIERK